MKFVLDTNILVSALLSPKGVCSFILSRVIERQVRICVETRIIHEYENVLNRPKLFRIRIEATQLLETLLPWAERISCISLQVILPDPTDLPCLEVAANAGAILVTGNTRHFPEKNCQGVIILTPCEMLNLLNQ